MKRKSSFVYKDRPYWAIRVRYRAKNNQLKIYKDQWVSSYYPDSDTVLANQTKEHFPTRKLAYAKIKQFIDEDIKNGIEYYSK